MQRGLGGGGLLGGCHLPQKSEDVEGTEEEARRFALRCIIFFVLTPEQFVVVGVHGHPGPSTMRSKHCLASSLMRVRHVCLRRRWWGLNPAATVHTVQVCVLPWLIALRFIFLGGGGGGGGAATMLVAVGGGWRLAVVGSWQLVAAGGWRRLGVGGWWRLAVGGGWQLVVGGWRSLGAVLKGGL